MRETERLCAGKNRVKMTGVKILTNPFLNCGYYIGLKMIGIILLMAKERYYLHIFNLIIFSSSEKVITL